MRRTSVTHPLHVNAVAVPGTPGLIGMTLCPGKVQSSAVTGAWSRDLGTDMQVIEDWGADIVITLMESHELKAVQVPHLPQRASLRMKHLNLPLPDGGIPGTVWENIWAEVGPGVRDKLRGGGKVLIHGLGGLGRTGSLAARLLVEFGMEPENAMATVRKARPGTIENSRQEAYVLAQKPLVEAGMAVAFPRPYHRIGPGRASRFRGCLLGGAIGDALGAPVEFMDLNEIHATFGPGGIRDYVPIYGRKGAITDDTQMTLFTAEGALRAHVGGRLGGRTSLPGVVAHAYQRWYTTQGGTVEVEGFVLDGWLIGHRELFSRRSPGFTCLGALEDKRQLWDSSRAINDSKGCGGVMRAAPIGLYTACTGNSAEQAFAWGCEIAELTHGHPTGRYPAGVLAMLIHDIVGGLSLGEALPRALAELCRHAGHEETLVTLEAAMTLAASPSLPQEALPRLGEGWVAEEALAIPVYCALRATNLEEAIVMAVNITGDSDSTGAITGNLMGAMNGIHEIPERWLEPLELRQVIVEMADDLATVNDWFVRDRPGDSEAERKEQTYWCDRYPGY